MPLDGLTLGYIARELDARLSGARIERVTQPEKDMLVLFLRANGQSLHLILSASPSLARVHLTERTFVNPAEAPMFCMLLRKHLTGGRLNAVRQLRGDRLLRFEIEAQDELGIPHPFELYFEAMGRHSNLTLVRDGRIIDAIRHVTSDMSRLRQALPGLPFILPPEQDRLPPEEATPQALTVRLSAAAGRLDKALSQTVCGLSSAAARELSLRVAGSEQGELPVDHLPALCARLSDFLRSLPERAAPTLLCDADGLPVDVFPFPYLSCPAALQRPMPSLSQAFEALFDGRDRRERMQQRSASLRRLLKTLTERSEKKLALQEEELLNAEHMEEYRVMGELLTANLHAVPRGAPSVALVNYYDGQTLTIPLDVRLSPAQNAQRYFKRYQKARSAARLAAEQKTRTQAELHLFDEALCGLDAAQSEDDLRDVRRMLSDAGFLKTSPEEKRRQQKNRRLSEPMRFACADGTVVSVGKNALQNDRLTQQAQGGDLWLHAKDQPGSHVIIHSEGRPVSQETLRDALRLAAYYSKGKGQGVTVDCTERRYVKRPSGAPPGFVAYTHQQSYLIDTSEAEIRKINQLS